MQKLLIRFVLDPLSCLTGKLSEKNRENLILLSGLGIFLYYFLYHMSAVRWRYLYSFAICCVLLGVMVLATLPKKIEPVRFNTWFTVCWFGAAGLMLLSGFTRNSDYFSEAMLLMFAYPIIYLCWNNWNAAFIFRLLTKLCKISLMIFFVVSFLLAQLTANRYGGIFRNVNNCASYLALAGVCLLAEMLYEHGSAKRSSVNILLFSMCYGMIELTNSRSGKLALLCAAAVGIVFYCVSCKFRIKKGIVTCLAGCVLLSAVMPTCLLGVFQLRQRLPLPYYDQVNYTFYFTGDWFQKPEDTPVNTEISVNTGTPANMGGHFNTGDQFNAEIPLTTEEAAATEAARDPVELIDPNSFDQFHDNKNNMEGKTIDQYSSGRITIWKEYLKRLTLFGVAKKEPVYLSASGKYINTAHMMPLEIAYESGIFAGIFFVLINMLSGILAITYAWRYREEKYALMPLMVILAFGVIAYTGSVNSSFNYMLTFYYYLVLFPIIKADTKCLANQ